MDADRGYRDSRVPLRELGGRDPAGRAGTRRDSFRRARRVSNWTAAALIVGTGAAAGVLAHQVSPAAPAAGAASAGGAGALAGTGGTTAQGASGPQVTHSVATTTASGVTVVTTTRSVNGKTVVSQVRQGGNNSFSDN